MAEAKVACGLFGYDGSGDYEKIGWDEKKLSFVVREPFPSNTTDQETRLMVYEKTILVTLHQKEKLGIKHGFLNSVKRLH